jgi:hypothetical protein
MGTLAMIRPGLYQMYATMPPVVPLSPAGGIHWTALWADVRASSTGLPEGQVAMVLVGSELQGPWFWETIAFIAHSKAAMTSTGGPTRVTSSWMPKGVTDGWRWISHSRMCRNPKLKKVLASRLPCRVPSTLMTSSDGTP